MACTTNSCEWKYIEEINRYECQDTGVPSCSMDLGFFLKPNPISDEVLNDTAKEILQKAGDILKGIPVKCEFELNSPYALYRMNPTFCVFPAPLPNEEFGIFLEWGDLGSSSNFIRACNMDYDLNKAAADIMYEADTIISKIVDGNKKPIFVPNLKHYSLQLAWVWHHEYCVITNP